MKSYNISFLKRFLPKGDFSHNVGILLGGNIIVQIVAMLVYPLLTRIYSPHEYGLLSLFTMVVTIPSTVASLKYEMAIPLPDDHKEASDVLVMALLLALLTSLLIGLVSVLAGSALMTAWNAHELYPYLWLVPFCIFACSTYQAFMYWTMRAKQFRLLAQTLVSKTIAETGTQLLAGLLHLGVVGLLLGFFIGNVAGNSKLGSSAWRQSRQYMRNTSLSSILFVSKKYSRFPIYTGTAGLLNTLAARIVIPFLGVMFGSTVVGWFSLACLALEAPSNVIRNAVLRVYYPEAAILHKENPIALRSLYLRSASRLCLLALFPLTAATLFAPWAAETFLGKSWGETGTYIRYLVPSYFFGTIAIPIGNFSALERQELGLLWNIALLLIISLGLYFSKVLQLSSDLTIVVYSASMCFGYIMMFIMSLSVIHSLCQTFSIK